MSLYRKKPVVIEAFKLGVDYIPDWFMDAVTANEVILRGTSSGFDHVPDTNADIHTLEGWHHANYGDYIIRGVKGELYPCKPDIFDMTYEVVDNAYTREKLIELCERSLNNDGTGREMRFVGGDVTPVVRRGDQKWIPVTDRLPEKKGNYLGFTGSTFMVGYYKGDAVWWIWVYDREGVDLFTHWMPLPEPPEGE